jgi:hypothetical protein
MRGETCFLAPFSRKPCEGELRKIHLIEKQALKRRGLDPWDEATWVWGCGGEWPGISAHHGELDSYKLQIPPEALPVALLNFAHEFGFIPYLERRFGYERAA